MSKAKLLLVLLLGSLLVSAIPAPAPKVALQNVSSRPNIIFILTDDLDTEYPDESWIHHFPRLRSLLAHQGTTFRNSFVSLSLCCPSRVSTLRGQYAHNTQIFTNNSPGGGFQKAHDLGLEDSTVATWLHDAGYRTILLGKYLNGYPGNLGESYVPPGWDEWYSSLRRGSSQFGYELNENGEIIQYGFAPEDYLQDVIQDKATDFIRRLSVENPAQPFFMWIATHSPHAPATFAPRHADAFPDLQAPRSPTFNEEDVSGQPQWVQNRLLLTEEQIATLDELYRKRLQSMLAVEETVEALIQALRETGQLDKTYIFFTSDNGFHLGQHRLLSGKSTGFEEDLRVPLLVRGPGVPAGRVLEHLVLNIDLAPTFAELAGIPAPDFVDGRSLVPLLGNCPPPVAGWRQAFLLEHGFLETGNTQPSQRRPRQPPPFQGLHTRNIVYIEYPTSGERELYDLDADPYEQINLAGSADTLLIAELATWLERLRTCSGAACRAAEAASPGSR